MIKVEEKINFKKIIAAFLFITMLLMMQTGCTEEIEKLDEDMGNLSGENTDEILGKSVDVTLGTFEVITGEYGITDTKLPVSVTNKTSETKSFSIQIEAVDESGKRLDTDTIYANNLTAGQSQDFESFIFITSDKLETMKNATFKIVEVSMY